jgi:hypothetical protein
MKKIFFLFIFLFLYGCNKPKTVLICGDHICVNKVEAEQYFEENLSLEVKILDSKKTKSINLVEINLESNTKGEKKITILDKNKTKKEIKVLTKAEINKKKANIKKKQIRKNETLKSFKKPKTRKKKLKKKVKTNKVKEKKIVKKNENKIIDICTILEKCNIDEISKYLVKQGKNKKFPDITNREN